ncbi:adenosine deaminase [Neomegalonema perideroedes]|uniref:adenosine deaminase n=1 Tax=Neomegalonema perideroedes TaxID=217219 RepID=UPI00035F24FB|nr:adenosine deaminase [Neomegalonema perideroedes]
MSAYAARLPKADLRLRLEGAVEPELAVALAERHGLAPEIETGSSIGRVADFAARMQARLVGLITAEDFHAAAAAALERAFEGRVRHVEMALTPQLHLPRGVAFAAMLEGIAAAFREARARGQTTRLLLAFRREFSEEEGFEILTAAEPFLADFIGVALTGPEFGQPPQKFARLFARAREMGLKLTCDAGQDGPPEYVRQAAVDLDVDRIDHGDAAAEFPALMREIVERRETLVLRPSANLALGLLDSASAHPLRTLTGAGVSVTLASGDPAWFGDLNANYALLAEELALSKSEILKLARTSFEAAFLTEEEREAHLAALAEAA